MSHITTLPKSPRRVVLERVIQALLASPDLQVVGAVLLLNPRSPGALAEVGPLVLVLKDGPDRLDAHENGRPRRESTFVLAAIARLGSGTGAQEADDHADRLHCAAVRAITSAQKSYSEPQGDSGVRLKALVSEVSTVFQVEGLQVDGGLVASTWSIRYQ